MHRQSTILAVILVVAVLIVVGLVATRHSSPRYTTQPGVSSDTQTSTSSSQANAIPCAQSAEETNRSAGAASGNSTNGIGSTQGNPQPGTQLGGTASTTNTATTTQGTTPDGRPTGAFIGAPCTPAQDAEPRGVGTSGTNGSGTTSQHAPGEPGSGATHGAQSGR